jgi:hypothetical protein
LKTRLGGKEVGFFIFDRLFGYAAVRSAKVTKEQERPTESGMTVFWRRCYRVRAAGDVYVRVYVHVHVHVHVCGCVYQ